MKFLDAENIKTLNNVLKYAEKGFYIFTTKTAAIQYDVADSLDLGDDVYVYDHSKDKRRYSYYNLAELMDIKHEFGKFIVLNFQFTLKTENDILNLNLSRDVLANHEKLWIFGMTEDMENKLARAAIDFYSYVMMKIRFKEKDEENEDGEKDEIRDKELAYALIRDYNKAINASESQAPEFLIRTHDNIAKLYRNMGKYAQALEHSNKSLEIRNTQQIDGEV